jgi:hypothetical protein
VSILLFLDSAYPQASLPAGVTGVCGYIGGDAVHTWTAAEWAAQKARWRLPVYVRSNPPGPGAAADVALAVAQLRVIGAPPGTLCAWDMETSTDAEYVGQVYEGLTAAGYRLILYGSQDFVTKNQNPDGYYWGADWTNVPHLYPGDAVTQFVSFAGYDLSEAQASLPFWDVRPQPVPAGPELLEVSVKLPSLTPGVSDPEMPHWYVQRLQALLSAIYGARLAVDGIYGPATENAVRAVQRRYSLPVTGSTDSALWEKVLAG